MAGPDPDDPATLAGKGRNVPDYREFLDAAGLKGARLGIVRSDSFHFNPNLDPLLAAAIEKIKGAGAVVHRPGGAAQSRQGRRPGVRGAALRVQGRPGPLPGGAPPASAIRGLADLIAFNKKNLSRELPYFGQEILLMADKKGPLTDKEYLAALKKDERFMRGLGIDAVMEKYKLDALVAVSNGPAHLTDLVNGDSFSGSSSTPAAVAGYPAITVPMGQLRGLPVGLSFFGRAWSEPTLLRLAYAFEQATRARTPPRFLPTVRLR